MFTPYVPILKRFKVVEFDLGLRLVETNICRYYWGFGGERRVEYIISPGARVRGTVQTFAAEATYNEMFGVPSNSDHIQPPDFVSHPSSSQMRL
jgi:hypothetical protein